MKRKIGKRRGRKRRKGVRGVKKDIKSITIESVGETKGADGRKCAEKSIREWSDQRMRQQAGRKMNKKGKQNKGRY